MMTLTPEMLKNEADQKITELFESYDNAQILFEDMTFQIDLINKQLLEELESLEQDGCAHSEKVKIDGEMHCQDCGRIFGEC